MFFQKNTGQGSSPPGRYNQSQSPKFRVQRVCNHLDFASISFNKKLDFKPFSGLYTYNFPLDVRRVSGSSPLTSTRCTAGNSLRIAGRFSHVRRICLALPVRFARPPPSKPPVDGWRKVWNRHGSLRGCGSPSRHHTRDPAKGPNLLMMRAIYSHIFDRSIGSVVFALPPFPKLSPKWIPSIPD